MAISNQLSIEVVYAKPKLQIIMALTVPLGYTLLEAIHQSGILLRFPEIDLERQTVGVFSEPRQLSDLVKGGDRIEIYRPLLRDPKDARRLRAKQRKSR